MSWAWTEANITESARLWNEEGRSAGEIAKAIGAPSRNTVAGKLARLGLTRAPGARVKPVGRTSPATIARASRTPKPRKPTSAVAPTPTPPATAIAVAEFIPARACILADLPRCACHWPLDDPGFGRMDCALFCAAPVAEGETYCEPHQARSVNARPLSRLRPDMSREAPPRRAPSADPFALFPGSRAA